MNYQLTALALLWSVLIGSVHPYPTNVPDAACVSMIPGHGGSPQTSPTPYKVEVSPQIVHQGDVVQVILSGTQPFQGFYVQGRTEDGTPIGTFIRSNTIKTHDCSGGKGNAAFHGVRGLKNNLEIFWKAPTDFEGQVLFTATFVSEFETFWTFVKAKPIFVKILPRRPISFSASLFAKLKEFAKTGSYNISSRIMNRKPKHDINRKYKFQPPASSAFPIKNSNIPYYQIVNSQSNFGNSKEAGGIGHPSRPNEMSRPPMSKLKTHNVNFHFTQPEPPPLFPMQINPYTNNIYGTNYYPKHENKINYQHQQFPYQFEYNGRLNQSHHRHPQQLTFSPTAVTSQGPIKTGGLTIGSILNTPTGNTASPSSGSGKRKTLWIMNNNHNNRFQHFKDVDDLIPNQLPADSFQSKETSSPYYPHHRDHHSIGEVTLDTPVPPNHSPIVNHANHLHHFGHHSFPPYPALTADTYHNSLPSNVPIGSQGHHESHHFPTHGFLVRNVKDHGSSPLTQAEPPFYLIPANKHDVDNSHGQYFNYHNGHNQWTF